MVQKMVCCCYQRFKALLFGDTLNHQRWRSFDVQKENMVMDAKLCCLKGEPVLRPAKLLQEGVPDKTLHPVLN